MSAILSFFRGGKDSSGRTLDEILAWDFERLEMIHDYIQWLFPLPERSGANPLAPVLTVDDILAFRRSPALRNRMVEGLRVMLKFYGLERVDGKARHIRRGGDFRRRAPNWLTRGNHNFLRLTRMLRSLRTVGLNTDAQLLFDALNDVYKDYASVIGEVTYRYWQNAINDPSLGVGQE